MDLTQLGILGGFVGWAIWIVLAVRRAPTTGPIVSAALGAAGAILGGGVVAPGLEAPEVALAVAGAALAMLLAQVVVRLKKA